MLVYSPRKINANSPSSSQILNSETMSKSDSPSEKSKEGGLVSAKYEINETEDKHKNKK